MNYNELIKTLEIDGKKVSEKYIAVFNSILKEKLIEKDDAIKCSNLLIEQLENQNDKLIKQRDDAEQELALYKKAFELAYYRGDEFICEEDVLKKAKEEIDEQKASEKERKE